METLNIRGMIKSRNLSRSIHEIGWEKLIEMIKYKSELYGREFVQIDRWFPSSKKCHVCEKSIMTYVVKKENGNVLIVMQYIKEM